MLRTPPETPKKTPNPDDEEKPKYETPVNTDPVPTARLAAVTRKKNEIEGLLAVPIPDLSIIREEYTEYLSRIERLQESCSESHFQWLKEHMQDITSFRLRVEAIIHPAVKPKIPVFSIPRPASMASSQASTTSSAKYKLAERKAQLKARQEVKEKEARMKLEELRIKAKHEEELLRLQMEKDELETLRMKKELEVMEEELDGELRSNEGISEILQFPEPVPAERVPMSYGTPNTLTDLLTKQNEISSAIVTCQQHSFLPKKELSTFDGSDITKFKRFMINFERTISTNCKEQDKLMYLQQYTAGHARKIVDSCVHFDPVTGFIRAKDLLESEYGNEFKVAQAYISKLHNWPIIKQEDPVALDNLGLFLLECKNYLENMTAYNQLQNPSEMMHVVNKLPFKLKDRWRRKTNNLLNTCGQVYFNHLVTFVREEASVLKQPIFGLIATKKDSDNHDLTRKTRKTLTTVSTPVSNQCLYCNKPNHDLSVCRFFRDLPFSEKSDFIKGSKICFACFGLNHRSRFCKNKMTCEVCKLRHPTIMHNEDFVKQTCNNLPENTSTNCSVKCSNKLKISCPVVPAKLKIKNRPEVITVNCALDTGSTDCWLNENLLRKLGLKPTEKNIHVSTMYGRNKLMKTKIVNNLQVLDLDENIRATIPVTFTKMQEAWPFTKDDLVKEKDIREFEHFTEIPFTFMEEEIGLLIGMNQPDLLKPLEIVNGEPGAPFASRHELGWAINGPVSRKGYDITSNRIKLNNEDLNAKIESYISQDFYDDTTKSDLSSDDQVWLKDVSSSLVILPDNHVQIDLPLRSLIELPDNKSQVYRMFQQTRDKVIKQNLLDKYDDFILDMLKEHFAEEVPQEELAAPGVWYIAHHGVFHKRKRTLRVVFNCSLKCRGISLNDCLRKGPDLANNLLDVLLKFRTEQTAVIADIRKMFYQVKVPKHHANLMRFFWTNSEGRVTEYRLLVHVFGATSSPSVANFALKSTSEIPECSQEAAVIINENFYVDDMLVSFPSEDEAISKSQDVKSTLEKRGFQLTAFCSNSLRVAETLNNGDSNAETSLLCDQTSALGITWNTRKDKLSFVAKFDNSADVNVVTKRNVLQTLASIYDPIGIVSPVIIPAKRLFQMTCREKLAWDEELPAHLLDAWKNWKKLMLTLHEYEIPRCTKLPMLPESVELHIFSDGSETAYGAVAFVRLVYEHGTSADLLASKSRLTPLNNSTLKTIPRIELCAAKLAVELSRKIKDANPYNFSQEHFWSDSTTVLSYIKNESLSFHRFVQNKVNFIKNFTNSDDWHYVNSKSNPADIVSRGTTPEVLKNSKLWNHGPEFLSAPEISYETFTLHNCDNDLEIKTTALTSSVKPLTPVDTLMESTSSWYKLKVRIASLVKMKNSLKNKTLFTRKISLPDLKHAEIIIFKYLQDRYYRSEKLTLSMNRTILRKSSLKQLHPFIDEDGLMKATGRIKNSILSYDMKYPVILPSCHVTKLLFESIHCSLGHLGRSSILSAVRQKFWIVKGNSLARAVSSRCITCKKVQGKQSTAFMADLPSQRVTGDNKPFTNVGADCFGPFFVTHGRKSEKRYGVLFTCMASRAVHIEVVFTMTTSSFIQALRRFLCRRGNVESIFSDNGTNFTGAQKELKEAIKHWNQSEIENWCKQKEILWKFNPPYSSHFGGHYERHIRTIRKVLTSILVEQNLRLCDETLLTLMCEVEAVLNNRPLTELSDDPSDFEPLTPNHILLFNATVTYPPGLFSKTDSYLKRRWRQTQYLADLFWKRWSKEYLILLQQRQKWCFKSRPHKIGDLVLVEDISLPRNNWPLGRITKISSGDDGIVRSAQIKISTARNSNLHDFSTKLVERPIVKLVLLRSNEDLI